MKFESKQWRNVKQKLDTQEIQETKNKPNPFPFLGNMVSFSGGHTHISGLCQKGKEWGEGGRGGNFRQR